MSKLADHIGVSNGTASVWLEWVREEWEGTRIHPDSKQEEENGNDMSDLTNQTSQKIEFNRQREKTPGQLVNEFEEMLAIEQERAKQREVSGGVEEFPQGEKGKSRDKAAGKIEADVSGRTLEKGKTVKDKAVSERCDMHNAGVIYSVTDQSTKTSDIYDANSLVWL